MRFKASFEITVFKFDRLFCRKIDLTLCGLTSHSRPIEIGLWFVLSHPKNRPCIRPIPHVCQDSDKMIKTFKGFQFYWCKYLILSNKFEMTNLGCSIAYRWIKNYK